MSDGSFEALMLGAGLVAALVAFFVTFRVGKSLVTGILMDGPRMPAWLEAVAPVKGRWLRLLLAGPGVALFLVLTFTVVFYMAVVAGAILGIGLMAFGSALFGR
jgi:hypothetical protein